jgi:anti-sigma B factor antagonist
MPNPFAVRSETAAEGRVSVLSLDGFLDAYTAPEFEKVIQAEIDAGRLRIVVDCAKLTYISSAGLGVFMGFIEEVREKGGDIKICGLLPKVLQVFELLGFPELFEIVGERPEALARFEKSVEKVS